MTELESQISDKLTRLEELLSALLRRSGASLPYSRESEEPIFRFANGMQESHFHAEPGSMKPEQGILEKSADVSRKDQLAPPDDRLIRFVVEDRKRRQSSFESYILSDPHWNILLDLMVAKKRGTKISVSSACIASGVPATTALRYVKYLEEIGLIQREPDQSDKRRIHLKLTPVALKSLSRYFDRLQRGIKKLECD